MSAVPQTPPVANNDEFGFVYSGGTVTIPVLNNDTDADEGDTLSVQSVGEVVGGSVVIDGNNIVFTADDGFFGDVSFTYTVVDSTGNTAEATVTGTVLEKTDTIVPGVPTVSELPEDNIATTDETIVLVDGETGAEIFVNGVSTKSYCIRHFCGR